MAEAGSFIGTPIGCIEANRGEEKRMRGTTGVDGRPAAPVASVLGLFCNPRAESKEEEEAQINC